TGCRLSNLARRAGIHAAGRRRANLPARRPRSGRRGNEMTEAHLFAIGVLPAWLAGIRVYLAVFGIGLAGFFGWLDLPQALEVTASPWVLGVSGVLAIAEFFADKIPGVDSGWDLLHTLLRVPAGAFLAAATLSPDGD